MTDLKTILASDGFDASDLAPFRPRELTDVACLTVQGGDAAVSVWRCLRDLVPRTGTWPVLLGELKEARAAADDEGGSVADTLSFAASINGAAWLARRRKERVEEFRDYNPSQDPAQFAPPVGTWPAVAQPRHTYSTPFDTLRRKPHKRVLVAFVPTTTPWEVPAHLNLGGWNECPEAAEHCAVLRYWHERHGAEIVAATRDVIEVHVARPPATREAAMALAAEQYDYCPDIIEQGTETLSNLASTLLGGTSWYFWWD